MTTTREAIAVDRPVFVIGCGRSGTTMLFEMLKAHPGLAPTTGHPDGEDHVGWVRHGKASIAGLYGNAATGNRGEVVGSPCCMHMDERHATDEIRASMRGYYAREILAGRPLRVVNKCPHLANKLRYVRAIFPDARFVHIVRNPVAMVASWVNIMSLVPELAVYWPQGEDMPCLWVFDRASVNLGGVADMSEHFYPGGGLLRFADYWTAINGNIPLQAAGFADQLLTVRYEDLISEPRATLRAITDFCDLAALPDVPVAIDRNRNSLRRQLLSTDDVERIRAITHTVALRHGYA